MIILLAWSQGEAMMKKWNDTDSSCSSVESDIMIVAFYYIRQQSNTITKRQRTFYTPIPKNVWWYQLMVPNLPVDRYRFFFRMIPMQFNYLLSLLLATDDPLLYKGTTSPEKKLHMYLYMEGNNPYNAEFSDRFAFADPIAVAYDMAKLINKDLYKKFVTWPTEAEKQVIKAQFEEFTGFKNIIGAVDGTHMQIIGTGKYKAGYTSRKCIYAINTTIVCDFNLKVLYASIGCPGSYHDNHVWEYTPVFNNPDRYFAGHDILLGDTAYTESQYIVAPYKAVRHNNSEKATFNYWHARGRVKSENTIGLIKGKWKIAGSTIRLKSIAKDVVFIKSIIPVHNILIHYNQSNQLALELEFILAGDNYISDHNEAETLQQHRPPPRNRISLNAAERKELMRVQKI